jgi:hypothetical protein
MMPAGIHIGKSFKKLALMFSCHPAFSTPDWYDRIDELFKRFDQW